VNRRAVIAFVLGAALLAVAAALAPRLVTLSQPEFALPAIVSRPAETVAPPSPGVNAPEQPESDATVDLYGNEVTSAVAKYSFDALGSLYELHSPQTEVPKLGPPKS
jgi:hypothetical protein